MKQLHVINPLSFIKIGAARLKANKMKQVYVIFLQRM